MEEQCWSWRGFSISYTCVKTQANGSSSGRAVLCVHGFGASKGHWRHNLAPLSSEATVYAIDLLGFGNSSKPISCLEGEPLVPTGVRYGFDLWAEQVRDFCLEVIGIGDEIEFTLGTVDQDHLLRFLVNLLQQPCGIQRHHTTDRVADQL